MILTDRMPCRFTNPGQRVLDLSAEGSDMGMAAVLSGRPWTGLRLSKGTDSQVSQREMPVNITESRVSHCKQILPAAIHSALCPVSKYDNTSILFSVPPFPFVPGRARSAGCGVPRGVGKGPVPAGCPAQAAGGGRGTAVGSASDHQARAHGGGHHQRWGW